MALSWSDLVSIHTVLFLSHYSLANLTSSRESTFLQSGRNQSKPSLLTKKDVHLRASLLHWIFSVIPFFPQDLFSLICLQWVSPKDDLTNACIIKVKEASLYAGEGAQNLQKYETSNVWSCTISYNSFWRLFLCPLLLLSRVSAVQFLTFKSGARAGVFPFLFVPLSSWSLCCEDTISRRNALAFWSSRLCLAGCLTSCSVIVTAVNLCIK